MRASILVLAALVGSGLGVSTAAWRSSGTAAVQDPSTEASAAVELPDYGGLEKYRFDDFVFKGSVSVVGESGGYSITYEGEDLFQVNFLKGSTEVQIPDMYTYMAARSTITVSGSWTRIEKDKTYDGMMQDTFQLQMPSTTVIRTFQPRAMRQMLEANDDGFDNVSWYRNSAVVVQVEDARLLGGDVTYVVLLGGHTWPEDYQAYSPPEDAIRDVVSGGKWRRVRDHHHEVATGYEQYESSGLDGSVVVTVIGVDGNTGASRFHAGGITDKQKRRAFNFQPTHPFLVGDYIESTEVAPFNPYDNDPEPVQVHVSWMLGARADIQATLTAVDEAAEQEPPEPGQMREYRLAVPMGMAVTAARFRLEEVTEVPGIATNAGNHVRYLVGVCPHCGNEVTALPYSADAESFQGQVVVRDYDFYSACPVDEAPDFYFRQDDNLGYELGPEADSGKLSELAYRAGISLTSDQALDEYVVRLTTADWGGTARLRAEFQVGGAWLPASAEGPTADGDALLIGFDGDGDLISDSFEDLIGRELQPGEDTDDVPVSNERGDGLSAYEEYRGVYVIDGNGNLGVHVRLDPNVKDLFIHDYSWALASTLSDVRMDYQDQTGLMVWELEDNGFINEIVNFWEQAPHRNGAQYTLVLMENPVKPEDVGFQEFYDSWAFWGGMAAHIGPPTAENHTIVLQHNNVLNQSGKESYLRRAVAHEIGHNINLPHHGDTAHNVTDPNNSTTRYFVAVPGSQLSGAADCIMRYWDADLFCDDSSPLACVDGWTFVPYVCASVGLGSAELCKAWAPGSEYLCASAAGTGVNAAGAWSGDATKGDCRSRIQIRSY